jgi:ATP-dependent Clp protease ATP-binding subunit ClpC
MPYAAFPGPASTFAREIVDASVRNGTKKVDPSFAVERFRQRTGLPELFLRDEIVLNRPEVFDWFQNKVIDQPEACEAATDIVMTVKSGLNDPARPLAVLLFCGPTGVGKTFMAQALAEYFFGHGDVAKKPGESPRLIRLDMSEFGGFDAVHRLFGPPNGEPGELIKRVRQQPFSVILLDEIEKAAAPIFDALMAVLDEGRLTDQYGRQTNFRSTIILMTSNLGAGAGTGIGFSRDRNTPVYQDAVRRFFRPEFFNRMDAVVKFDSLSNDSVKAITRRELASIAKREGVVRLGIQLEWTASIVDRISDIGFDSRYGARPLQRIVERLVVAELAKWLLENPVKAGPGCQRRLGRTAGDLDYQLVLQGFACVIFSVLYSISTINLFLPP